MSYYPGSAGASHFMADYSDLEAFGLRDASVGDFGISELMRSLRPFRACVDADTENIKRLEDAALEALIAKNYSLVISLHDEIMALKRMARPRGAASDGMTTAGESA